MKRQKVLCTGLILAASVIVSQSALADNCNGRFSNVNVASETVDLGNGHTLTIFASRSTATSENSAHTGVGMCGGYFLTLPDGTSRVGFACGRKDANGDSWSDFGGVEPGADRGTWTQSGGTGVFAGKKNSGWWQGVVSDGVTDTGVWGGNCK